jgi:hypothetical protein
MRDIKIPRKGGVLPMGAVVSGFISRLENRYIPTNYVVLGIQLNQLTAGNRTYTFDAQLDAGTSGLDRLRLIYGRRVPSEVSANLSSSLLVFGTSHLHLDQHFTAVWVTKKTKQTEQP